MQRKIWDESKNSNIRIKYLISFTLIQSGHMQKSLVTLFRDQKCSLNFLHAHMLPTHLHSCVLCSCRMAAASTCLTLDCKTPPKPNCSCRRLLPPHTISCLPHTHLKSHRISKIDCPVEQHLRPLTDMACVTCVTPTHVHVCHLSPAVSSWVVNFTALPHQWTIVTPHSIQ